MRRSVPESGDKSGAAAFAIGQPVETQDDRQVMTLDSTERTSGEFRQRGNDPKNDAFATGGRFRAEWRCRKEGWRVQRMQTFAGE
jgi:hypothetical protein